MKPLLREIWRWRQAYLFMAPAVLLVLAIRFYPTLDAIRLSFYDMHLGRPTRFVGLENYVTMLSDQRLITNLRITAIFAASTVVLSFILGFGFALLLWRASRGFTFFRTVLFIPYVIALIVVALMWRWLLDPVQGLLNYLLTSAGFESVLFLARPITAMWSLIIVAVWNLYPFPMVLLLAGLTSIPQELYAAARVDGVGAWQQLTQITLPLLRPTMFITLTMLTLFSLYAVELPLALTSGGPALSTEILGVRLYVEAFQYFNRGYASTIGVLTLAINIVLVVLYGRIFQSKAYY
ncbi:MAG: sugar ABC transporter permease [Chloroflexi bacterium]|nr:sugar ABC transporter permease [Chloroflexota bacterium]